MAIYGRVYEGRIVETCETEGDISTMFHPDMVWIDLSGNDPLPGEGWIAKEVNGAWELSEPVPVMPTPDQLKAEALALRENLMEVADERTLGMADAFIAGLLNEEETSMFKDFAAYKLALKKIDVQPNFPLEIIWPTPPAYV